MLLGPGRPRSPARSPTAWGCRTSRSTCGASSAPGSSTRSSPATRRGRRRTRAWAATATCGSTRCSSSPTASAPPTSPPATTRARPRTGCCGPPPTRPRTSRTCSPRRAPATLARLRFPLGELTKPQVRALAAEAGLPVASKPDSQDLCFLAGTGKAAFLARHGRLADRPGDLVDAGGRVLGRHRGHHHFTVGQRRGLGVAATEPLYVLAKDARSNRVTVGPREALATATVPVRGARLHRAGERGRRRPPPLPLPPGRVPPHRRPRPRRPPAPRARALRPGRRRRPGADRVPAERRRGRRLGHDRGVGRRLDSEVG